MRWGQSKWSCPFITLMDRLSYNAGFPKRRTKKYDTLENKFLRYQPLLTETLVPSWIPYTNMASCPPERTWLSRIPALRLCTLIWTKSHLYLFLILVNSFTALSLGLYLLAQQWSEVGRWTLEPSKALSWMIQPGAGECRFVRKGKAQTTPLEKAEGSRSGLHTGLGSVLMPLVRLGRLSSQGLEQSTQDRLASLLSHKALGWVYFWTHVSKP